MSRKKDGEDDIQRRSFLKNTAAAGAGAIGFAAFSKGAAAKDVTVTEVTGSDSAKLRARALKDARVGKLLQSFDGNVRPQMNEGYVYHTVTSDDEWDTVVIPLTQTENRQVNLFWTTNDLFDSQVVINEAERASGTTDWEMTDHYIADDSVATSRDTVSTDEFTKDQVSTQGVLDCNVNWGCVLSTAGAYAGTVGACGSCYASSGLLVPACASCIGTILGSAGLTITCDYCH